jgi:hypothetical protein
MPSEHSKLKTDTIASSESMGAASAWLRGLRKGCKLAYLPPCWL